VHPKPKRDASCYRDDITDVGHGRCFRFPLLLLLLADVVAITADVDAPRALT
jgi:hypothetical protein